MKTVEQWQCQLPAHSSPGHSVTSNSILPGLNSSQLRGILIKGNLNQDETQSNVHSGGWNSFCSLKSGLRAFHAQWAGCWPSCGRLECFHHRSGWADSQPWNTRILGCNALAKRKETKLFSCFLSGWWVGAKIPPPLRTNYWNLLEFLIEYLYCKQEWDP